MHRDPPNLDWLLDKVEIGPEKSVKSGSKSIAICFQAITECLIRCSRKNCFLAKLSDLTGNAAHNRCCARTEVPGLMFGRRMIIGSYLSLLDQIALLQFVRFARPASTTAAPWPFEFALGLQGLICAQQPEPDWEKQRQTVPLNIAHGQAPETWL